MDTSNPLPAPVTVQPQRWWSSLTLIANAVFAAGALIAAPQLLAFLGAIGVHDIDAKLATWTGAIAALNVLLRLFKTKAPIAGTPAETKARASG